MSDNGNSESKMSVNSITIRTFIHATETLEKVLNALKNLFPKSSDPSDEQVENIFSDYKLVDLVGHFKNPLTSIEIKLTNRAEMRSLLKNLGNLAPPANLYRIKSSLEVRIENNKFVYLRLDKQNLAQGRIDFWDKGDVQLILNVINKNPRVRTTIDDITNHLIKEGLFPN